MLLFFLFLAFVIKSDWARNNPLYDKLSAAIFSLCVLGGKVVSDLNAFLVYARSFRMLFFYIVFLLELITLFALRFGISG